MLDPYPLSDETSDIKMAFHAQVQALETRLIEQALFKTAGNKTKAASLLQIDFKTLALKIKTLGIKI
jgi:DNA-binding NtrC family response regulator